MNSTTSARRWKFAIKAITAFLHENKRLGWVQDDEKNACCPSKRNVYCVSQLKHGASRNIHESVYLLKRFWSLKKSFTANILTPGSIFYDLLERNNAITWKCFFHLDYYLIPYLSSNRHPSINLKTNLQKIMNQCFYSGQQNIDV